MLLKKVIIRAIFSFTLLYCYNLVAVTFNMIIPINYVTLPFVFCFGSVGVIGLGLFKYFIL